MIDLDDHPFSPKNIARESGAPDPSKAAWLNWVKQTEYLLGHDIDGDDVGGKGDGYSLDEALTMFDRGVTPHAYVEQVTARERYAPPAVATSSSGPTLG